MCLTHWKLEVDGKLLGECRHIHTDGGHNVSDPIYRTGGGKTESSQFLLHMTRHSGDIDLEKWKLTYTNCTFNTDKLYRAYAIQTDRVISRKQYNHVQNVTNVSNHVPVMSVCESTVHETITVMRSCK